MDSGDVVVVVVVRQSAGYDAMKCAKCYLFCSVSATKLQGTVAVVVAVVVVVVVVISGECFRDWQDS